MKEGFLLKNVIITSNGELSTLTVKPLTILTGAFMEYEGKVQMMKLKFILPSTGDEIKIFIGI
jgi:hypothetical protein